MLFFDEIKMYLSRSLQHYTFKNISPTVLKLLLAVAVLEVRKNLLKTIIFDMNCGRFKSILEIFAVVFARCKIAGSFFQGSFPDQFEILTTMIFGQNSTE